MSITTWHGLYRFLTGSPNRQEIEYILNLQIINECEIETRVHNLLQDVSLYRYGEVIRPTKIKCNCRFYNIFIKLYFCYRQLNKIDTRDCYLQIVDHIIKNFNNNNQIINKLQDHLIQTIQYILEREYFDIFTCKTLYTKYIEDTNYAPLLARSIYYDCILKKIHHSPSPLLRMLICKSKKEYKPLLSWLSNVEYQNIKEYILKTGYLQEKGNKLFAKIIINNFLCKYVVWRPNSVYINRICNFNSYDSLVSCAAR